LKLNKTIIEREKENNQLLEKQLKFQNILLLNVENFRRQSIQRHENVKNTLKITENRTFHEELIACMDLQFNNISQRLLNSFPELTNRDILICCLLLANFETGMIATILDVKNDSVRIHRTRLRKKLNLQNHENIIEFLSRF
jgi:DNA-binding CsgD family transcriptional regulator